MQSASVQEELVRIGKVEFERKSYASKVNLIAVFLKSQKYVNKVECLQQLAKTLANLEMLPEQLIKDFAALRLNFKENPEDQELLVWFLNCLVCYQTRLMISLEDSDRLLSYFNTLLNLGLTEDRIHLLFEQLPLVLTEDEREFYANLTWEQFYKMPSAVSQVKTTICPF